MSKLRFRVVEEAFQKRAEEVTPPKERPSDFFGQNVFNRAKMFKYLPEKTYEKITDCIDNGTPLDRATADAVAAGMKKWAIEMGVTHYTHWFHPLTEGTAEKHAFAGVYDNATLKKWLYTFFRRFFQQQFKRSCLPDGPKVGSISLSPRGDWRMI